MVLRVGSPGQEPFLTWELDRKANPHPRPAPAPGTLEGEECAQQCVQQASQVILLQALGDQGRQGLIAQVSEDQQHRKEPLG